ncbi:MAG TPA: GyrI-like domain-containing protein [Streptosporangiaceae bacterium]
MADGAFDSEPRRVFKSDVLVMLERTTDELSAIHALWPRFERRVGLRGRKMYALVDVSAGSYATCTPVKPEDDPGALGLDIGVLPGGWYLVARIVGEPPALYDRIAPAMTALIGLAAVDRARPQVEFYRRYDQVELWSPVHAE